MKSENETNIIGNSEPVRWLRSFIAKVAPFNINILLTGPTGSGKTLTAQEIHTCSGRGSESLLKIHARSLSDEIIEHELFQFPSNLVKNETSAKGKKSRFLEISTLIIEDICELSEENQAKLVTILEECQTQRFGDKISGSRETRIISTTRKDATSLQDDTNFRRDLYFRLSGSVIYVPPLKERLEDLPFLTKHILDGISAKLEVDTLQISVDALHYLQSYDWPGNIRELENVLETASVLRETQTLGMDEVKNAFRALLTISSPKPDQSLGEYDADFLNNSLHDQMQNLEKELIIRSLLEAKGVQTVAARRLGLTPKNLWKKMQKHGIRSKKLLSLQEYQQRLEGQTPHPAIDSTISN